VRRVAGLIMVVGLAVAGCSDGVDEPSDLTMVTSATTTTTRLQFPTVSFDPGDATEDELDLLFQVGAASFRGNEVDMTEVFAPDAVFDTGLRGIWEGTEEIQERSETSALVYYIANIRDFTRIEDRLVFNWQLFRINGEGQGQGVEASFEDGLIDSLTVSSLSVPYCIGETGSGCKDYETGEVVPLDPSDLPFCGPGVNGPCRDQ